MLVIVGYLVVIGAIFGGFALAGGHMAALLQPVELLMIFGCHFLWGGSLLFSTNCNRCSVLVAARNHQHLIALKTMIPRKNIGWQISTSNMSQM